MIFGFLSLKTLLVIVHLFGVAFGVGGAIASDLMFFHVIRDRIFGHADIEFLKLGSRMVWIGVALLVLSGAGMFFLAPEAYLGSSKFLAKMTVVGIIIVNGIFFHTLHLPLLLRSINTHFSEAREFQSKRIALLISGAVSLISWSCALILGALRTLPYSYTTIMGAYVLILAGGIAGAIIVKDRILPITKEQ